MVSSSRAPGSATPGPRGCGAIKRSTAASRLKSIERACTICSVLAAGAVGPRYAARWIVVLMTSTSQRVMPYAAQMAVDLVHGRGGRRTGRHQNGADVPGEIEDLPDAARSRRRRARRFLVGEPAACCRSAARFPGRADSASHADVPPMAGPHGHGSTPQLSPSYFGRLVQAQRNGADERFISLL